VMLIVIGHKRDEVILIQDLRAQHGLVPFDHLLEVTGPQHCMSELLRRNRPGAIICDVGRSAQ
jgi:hypothetical protein